MVSEDLKKKIIILLHHFSVSLTLTSPIILSSLVDSVLFKKSRLPHLPPRDIATLFLLTTVSIYGLEYLLLKLRD